MWLHFQMALLSEEKLPECDLPQLETRLQCVSAHVLHHNQHHLVTIIMTNNDNNNDNNRWKQLGEIECLALVIACLCHDLDHRGGSILLLSISFQFHDSRDQQQLPSQVQQQPGPPVLYLNDGASPLWPVPHAPQHKRQPAPGKCVKGDELEREKSRNIVHSVLFDNV